MPRECGAQIRDPETPRRVHLIEWVKHRCLGACTDTRRASGSRIYARIATASGHPSGMTSVLDLGVKFVAPARPPPCLAPCLAGLSGIAPRRGRVVMKERSGEGFGVSRWRCTTPTPNTPLPPEERSEFRGLPLGGGASSTQLRQAGTSPGEYHVEIFG
jgi:hypothetical protein